MYYSRPTPFINYCLYLKEVYTTGRETIPKKKKMFKANNFFFFENQLRQPKKTCPKTAHNLWTND